MKRNLMSELKEGMVALTRDQLLKEYAAIIDEQREEIDKLQKQIVKMLREFQEIEQILGKALMYPWFKDDQCNFPNATEADGVAIGDHTAWSLAMCAADKIKELQKQLDKEYERGYQEGVDAEYERNNFRKD
jgi:uncharacterized coiled-coil protein SlyX